MTVELVILVDNDSSIDNVRSEHGLSILMASQDKQVLFDTGASEQTLLHNAALLSAELDNIDGVVISHGHLNHTGGLAALASKCHQLQIHAHPGTFNRRWADHPGKPLKEISCPHTLGQLHEAGAFFQPVNAPEMITDWLVLFRSHRRTDG